MIFHQTSLDGVVRISPERHRDDRGYFARTFCEDEFAAAGLCTRFVQSSVSFNEARNTLRGMHFQAEPGAEIKVVRCTRGAIYDVALDLRSGSETFGKWVGCELNEENGEMLYLPQGIAHGFQTLAPESEVFYQISALYQPELARGVRWNDPAFAIEWPSADHRTMSQRDREYPDFQGR